MPNVKEGKISADRDVRARAFAFSLKIIKLVGILPRIQSARIISDQVLRSSMSIGANLTEAKGSGTRLEYKRFFEISLKSAHETRYWLQLLQDSAICNKMEIGTLLNEVEELIRMISSAVISLKSSH